MSGSIPSKSNAVISTRFTESEITILRLLESLIAKNRMVVRRCEIDDALRIHDQCSSIAKTILALEGIHALEPVPYAPSSTGKNGRVMFSELFKRANGTSSWKVCSGAIVAINELHARPAIVPPDMILLPLTSNELNLLEFLKQCRAAPSNVDIATGIKVSERTVTKLVQSLLGRNLIHRPHGERKGLALTELAGSVLQGA